MNSKTLRGLLVSVVIVALIGVVVWQRQLSSEAECRAQIITTELQPIAILLKENAAIIQELSSNPLTNESSGFLESYLTAIRRDGVAKHAEIKRRIDQLAENNTAIVTLIKAYSPHVRTLAFGTEADKFRNFASAWRDRWNSVMELYMAGGNFASMGAPFPEDFEAAVQAEIVAASK